MQTPRNLTPRQMASVLLPQAVSCDDLFVSVKTVLAQVGLRPNADAQLAFCLATTEIVARERYGTIAARDVVRCAILAFFRSESTGPTTLAMRAMRPVSPRIEGYLNAHAMASRGAPGVFELFACAQLARGMAPAFASTSRRDSSVIVGIQPSIASAE